MRTNIVLDDELLDSAFCLVQVKTKKELVKLAMKEFVENHSRKNLLDLKGKVKICGNYDYKKMRKNRNINGSR